MLLFRISLLISIVALVSQGVAHPNEHQSTSTTSPLMMLEGRAYKEPGEARADQYSKRINSNSAHQEHKNGVSSELVPNTLPHRRLIEGGVEEAHPISRKNDFNQSSSTAPSPTEALPTSATSLILHRLTDTGWQTKIGRKGTWTPTRQFDLTTPNETGPWICTSDIEQLSALKRPLIDLLNTRGTVINKRIRDITTQLPGISEISFQAKKLNILLSLWSQAASYHTRCMNELMNSQPGSQDKLAKFATDLYVIQRLNDHPNKVEQSIPKVEASFSYLDEYQAALSNVTARLYDRREIPRFLEPLVAAHSSLTQAIQLQDQFIDSTVSLVRLISLPFKQDLAPEFLAENQELLKNSKIQQIHALKAYLEAKRIINENNEIPTIELRYINCAIRILNEATDEIEKVEPNQDSIDHFFRAAELYHQAVAASESGQTMKTVCLRHAGKSFYDGACEEQKAQPNQDIIDHFLQAAGLYQQALAASESLHTKQAKYLSNAATSFYQVACEEQKDQPSQDIVDRFLQAAGLYQQAFAALESAHTKQATYLNNAADSFYGLACEGQKSQPKQDVIDRFLQAAGLYQQALAAFNAGQEQQAHYLNNVANSFYKAACEMQNAQPNQDIINRFLQASELYQQAVAAFNPDRTMLAHCLNNKGSSFYEAAREAQKDQPNQDVIDRFLQAAEFHQQAFEAFNPDRIMLAHYLNNKGNSFYEAAREAQKDQPNQDVIDHFLQAAGLYQQAFEAFNATQINQSIYLNNAAGSFCEAAREQQKNQPDRQKIESLLQSAQDALQQSKENSFCVIN